MDFTLTSNNLFLHERLGERTMWKAAIVEGVGAIAFAWQTGMMAITLVTGVPPVLFSPSISLVAGTTLALFIYTFGVGTGAHFNPLISFSTALCGIMSVERALVYIVMQCIGSAIGGALVRSSVGTERAVQLHNGGCFLAENGPITVSQAVAIEFMACFVLLVLCYGAALDPKQSRIYHPAFQPILVGLSLAIVLFVTTAHAPGQYTGAGLFPARCFGLAVGIGSAGFQRTHWIWWVPDALAAVTHSLLYRFSPPSQSLLPPPPDADEAPTQGGSKTPSVEPAAIGEFPTTIKIHRY